MPKRNSELAVDMGKRMLKRRRELGLTQEQVAELAGIAHQQYNKAENGKTCVGSDTLLHIALALRVSADYLLTGIDDRARYFDTMKLLEQMSERQLKLVNSVLRSFLQFDEAPVEKEREANPKPRKSANK